MRISSQTLQLQWLADVYRRQASLARIQKQVTSGQRINTAADDPAGAGQIVALKQGIDRLTNYGANAEAARRRLSLEENALARFGDSLARVRELAVQAGGGIQNVETRTAIAAEMRELYANMVDTANSQDGEGRYLFAGNAVSTRPVAIVNGVATYNGDDGVRSQRIGDSRSIREGDPGSEVFFGIRNGNGTFAVAAGANTGTGFLQNATVTNPAAWVADTYTISFTTPTTYAVTNSGGAIVASGAWQPGNAVQFAGVSVVIAGQPSAGDSFSVSPSTNRSAFETVNRLVAALEGDSVTPQGRAAFQTALNDSLMSLDQVEGQLNDVRSTIGARLAALDEQKSSNEELSIQLQSTLSTVRDVDYAAAITALEREMTSLEAAQKVFARTQTLSLFDVL